MIWSDESVSYRLYKPEIECFDEPLTIRQTEENTGRSYTGFLKSLFTSSGTAGANPNPSTGTAPSSSSIVPSEKLTELDVKGIKGAKELSRVVYSADRGKLETVLLKPGSAGAGGNKGSFELQLLWIISMSFLFCRRKSTKSA